MTDAIKEKDDLQIPGELPKVEIKKKAAKTLEQVAEEDRVSAIDRKAGARKFRIVINESGEGPDAKRDVFVSVNGFPCLIQRGKPVVVREGILNVLRESVTTQMMKDEQSGEDIYTDVPRFSLQILGEVNDL